MRNLFCTAAVLAEAEFTVSHIAAMIKPGGGGVDLTTATSSRAADEARISAS
jgi:hypothetical protein